MTPPKIVALREGDLPAAAAALSRAFQDDPLQTYVLPDPVERAAQSPGTFCAATPVRPQFWGSVNHGRFSRRRGRVAWTRGVGGHPRARDRSRAGQVAGCPWRCRRRAILFHAGGIDPYHHRDVPPAHWYVMVVGVAPEKQGKGIGRALLQPIIKRADTAGQPCYLETAQPANVGLYERLGFRRVVDMVEPQSGLRLWTFRRDPAAPR
jgi:Acetyltransferases